MEKLIITAAVNGGITPRSKNPAVPYTPGEIADAVYGAWNAGASIAHIHARDNMGHPAYDLETWQLIAQNIRARCDIILNFSTSGLNLPDSCPKEQAWNHLVLKPEIASFNCGSVNHNGKPFINPPELAVALAKDLNTWQVKPEIEVYHSGVISEAVAHSQNGFLKPPLLFALAMGIHGGIPASCKNLLHLVESLPPGSIWSALAIGKSQLPINVHSILLGGHVRTGLEDNVYFRKGELAVSNAQLVERVVRLSEELGRAIASPKEARQILSLQARYK